MDFLQSLCSVPTAPFAESRVADYVADFVARRKNLSLQKDRFGNLLIELKIPSRRGRPPRWVFTAHMDHPGFIARKMRDPRTLRRRLSRLGESRIRPQHTRSIFDASGEIAGKVIDATVENYDLRAVPHEVLIRVDRPVAPHSPGMFDQGEGRYKGGKFFCRCCDDLAGAAACLAMLDQLHRKPPRSPVAVLFTRAEEEGFIGCVAACQHRTLLRKTDRVIAIECSSVQPVAPQGEGVIIRVGDRASVFNSALTYFLGQQAEELKKKTPNFRHQRALMPGGVCEATAYDIWGYTAASLCVALGNYHNMDVKRKTIAPEFIDVADWKNMVRLFVRLAERGHEFVPGHGVLRGRILKRFNRLQRFLT